MKRFCSLFFVFSFCVLTFSPSFSAAQLPPPEPNPRFGGADMEILGEVGGLIGSQLYLGIGQTLASQFGPGGSQMAGSRYREHPWRDDDFGWVATWIGDDTGALFEDFGGCFDFGLDGFCLNWVYPWGVPVPVPGVVLEWWMPHVVVETNNYAIGQAPLVVLLRGIFLQIRDLVLPLLMFHYEDVAEDLGYSRYPEDIYPNGLDDDDHTGQSHTVPSGTIPFQETFNMEAHTYRPFLDMALNFAISIFCAECANMNFAEQYYNWTEMILSPFWRIPEMTMMRSPVNYIRGVLPGLSYHGNRFSPFLGMFPDFSFGVNLLPFATCASYRFISHGNPIALSVGMMPFGIPGMDPKCYQEELGQLYPLIGNIDVSSERFAPILATRRMLEWTTWSFLPPMFRTKVYHEGTDKLQRIFPDEGDCYRLSDVDRSNYSKWPTYLTHSNAVEERGERRITFWNRRECCFSYPQECRSDDWK